jgi:hypothetical protein
MSPNRTVYADGLPERDPDGYAALRRYAASHKPDVDLTYLRAEPYWDPQLLSRSQFVQQWLWHVGYPHHNRRDPATIVMFNAPFDLSRLAVDAAEARDDMRGGFSYTVWHTPGAVQERCAGEVAFVGQGFDVGDAGAVVDGDVQVVVADRAAVDLAAAGVFTSAV